MVVGVVLAISMTRVLGAAGGQVAAPPPDGPFLGWDVVGNAVSGGVDNQVVTTWDASAQAHRSVSPEPHTEPRVLASTRNSFLGTLVIAQAYDGAGQPRIAFFTSGPNDGAELVLRADRPAPDPVSTKVVSLVSARLQGPAGAVSGDYWGAHAVVLAMPGVTAIRLSSTTIDDEMREGDGGDTGPLLVQPLPISSTALTTTITGYNGKTHLFTAHADGGAIGDAQPVAARVISRSAQQLTVSLNDAAPVEPGQLAATREGLVGRVTSVDQTNSSAVIELVTAEGFHSVGYTDISNHHGQINGTGSGIEIGDLATDAEINPGNRVLVPDPAQQDDRAGALTIARASSSKSPGATSPAQLAPTADLANVSELSILVPSAKG
jgi:hypothetical protein